MICNEVQVNTKTVHPTFCQIFKDLKILDLYKPYMHSWKKTYTY